MKMDRVWKWRVVRDEVEGPVIAADRKAVVIRRQCVVSIQNVGERWIGPINMDGLSIYLPGYARRRVERKLKSGRRFGRRRDGCRDEWNEFGLIGTSGRKVKGL